MGCKYTGMSKFMAVFSSRAIFSALASSSLSKICKLFLKLIIYCLLNSMPFRNPEFNNQNLS